MQYKAIIATNKEDSQNDIFTDEALEQMKKAVVGKDIRLNFDGPIVGKIIKAKLVYGKVSVLAQIYDSKVTDVYLCPFFSVNEYSVDGNTRYIKSAKFFDIGLWATHADNTIKPILETE